ncbi:putative transcriptional regulatory protein C3C7.04 [Fusarium austroafricanum]|uniref:Putative transcriptional regulatory protein C3C7.04 n=1 Tax=Fusarium austroafricanum TaxID=2364996 RepID=A0A8H4KVS9_9HYPO|nr:putative transcriptional regulatory protein C3C7.04 [Fusarium austroafricanum]
MPDESRNPSLEGSASTQPDALLRSACTECHRRKQKCNRQWPCNNCQKRKVADQCRFKDDSKGSPSEDAWAPSVDVKRKRDMRGLDDDSDSDVGDVLEAIGYSRLHLLTKLDQDSGTTKPSEQYRLDPKTDAKLKRALDVLPPRNVVDSLIQSFLDVVNFYYYIVYPPYFSKEYALWWDDYTKGRPCGVQWTCLLLMVCACSVQHIDGQLRSKIENELGEPVKELTQRYHDAARELHSAIPVGYGHVYTVQYLLHSCYWFKAEARFAECWQVLGAVVREAQMINLHKMPEGQLPGFELEMKRRLWCIVDSWDWLVSCLLARPMLIDRKECDVGLPSLTLEDYPASPMLHLKLQSQLVGLIFDRFGGPKILTDPQDIRDYQTILEDFMKTFPPEYAMDHPNTPSNEKLPWIALHRHYMHTCTLSIALGPFRGYMAKTMKRATASAVDLEFRETGIDYALRLMEAVHRFFEYVWTRDTTFHFVPFCIFDTAALLCSVIIHAEDGLVPRREEVISSVARAFTTLKKLRTATNTAKAPYDVLRRLIKKLPSTTGMQAADAHKKRRFETPPGSNGAIAIPIAAGPVSQRGMEPSVLVPTVPSQMPVQVPQHAVPAAHYQQYLNPPPPPPMVPVRMQAGQRPPMPYPQDLQEQHFQNYTYAQQQMYLPPTNGRSWSDQIISADMQNFTAGPLPPDMPFQISEAELGDLAMLWNWESLDLGFTSNPIYQNQ